VRIIHFVRKTALFLNSYPNRNCNHLNDELIVFITKEIHER